MFKTQIIVLIFMLFSQSVFASKLVEIIDDVQIRGTSDDGRTLKVYFYTSTHQDWVRNVSFQGKHIHYECVLTSLQSEIKIAEASSDLDSLTFFPSFSTRKANPHALVSCNATNNGKVFSSAREVILKSTKPYRSHKKFSQVKNTIKITSNHSSYDFNRKTLDEIAQDNALQYQYAPNIFIENLHIYNIKKLSYRNNNKTHIIINASSGNYLIPVAKLKEAKLINVSTKLHKQLEVFAGVSINNNMQSTKDELLIQP